MQRNIFVIYNHWKKKKQFLTCTVTVTLSNVLHTKSLHNLLSILSTVDSTATYVSRGGALGVYDKDTFFFIPAFFFSPRKYLPSPSGF